MFLGYMPLFTAVETRLCFTWSASRVYGTLFKVASSPPPPDWLQHCKKKFGVKTVWCSRCLLQKVAPQHFANCPTVSKKYFRRLLQVRFTSTGCNLEL